jgi:hypothetical protein
MSSYSPRLLLTGLGQLIAKLAHLMRRVRYNRTHTLLPSLPGGYAACGQDVLVAALLGNQRNGVFVDIGANDGVSISNSLYFEERLGWTGLAVEPLPGAYARLCLVPIC